MKKKTGIVLGVIGLIMVLIVVWGVSTYNGIVNAETQVDQRASDVQNMMQRRGDLIPNLVNTVKGYATHEEEIMNEISEARAKLAGAQTVNQGDAANTELNNALSRLLVVVENYPDLKANQTFTGLMDELSGSENRIAIARKDYIGAVQAYNLKIRQFPSSIIAGMNGFTAKESFQASESAQSVPEVSF